MPGQRAPLEPARRALRRLAGTRLLSLLAARTFPHLDRLVVRASGGRRTLSGLLTGLPILTLITVGARSGLPRRTPLIGIPDGEAFILVASNFGQGRLPAWYHNLRADPRATLLLADGQSRAFLAREATAAERARCWALADAVYPGYAAYRRRVGEPQIPLLILRPLPDPASQPVPHAPTPV